MTRDRFAGKLEGFFVGTLHLFYLGQSDSWALIATGGLPRKILSTKPCRGPTVIKKAPVTRDQPEPAELRFGLLAFGAVARVSVPVEHVSKAKKATGPITRFGHTDVTQTSHRPKQEPALMAKKHQHLVGAAERVFSSQPIILSQTEKGTGRDKADAAQCPIIGLLT